MFHNDKKVKSLKKLIIKVNVHNINNKVSNEIKIDRTSKIPTAGDFNMLL